jgi:ribosomal protein S18 acetylase RimI-like enzyme
MIGLSDINIRRELLPGDLGYIAYVHGLLYAKELGYGLNFEAYVLGGLQEFARQYDAKKDRIWVCQHGEKIIGFLVGFHRDDIVQFRYFIFLPEYRGLGLGKVLMNEFIGYMKECGCNKAYLWTTNEQQAAISLYTRYGFKLTEEKQSHAFDKALTELRYDLVLE